MTDTPDPKPETPKADAPANESAPQATPDAGGGAATQIRRLSANRPALVVRSADEKERAAHTAFLDNLDKLSNGACLWRQST